MKLLLAVDGSESSQAAVEAVIRTFVPQETEVRVLHAVEWLKELPLCFQFAQGAAAGHDIVACRSQSFDRAHKLVDGVAAQLESKGFHATVSTPDADPSHAIIEAAKQWPSDLIVLGSHGRRGLDRWLLGSVAESVARNAPCSVEIVRRSVAA